MVYTQMDSAMAMAQSAKYVMVTEVPSLTMDGKYRMILTHHSCEQQQEPSHP
jgi:hypothetical protein